MKGCFGAHKHQINTKPKKQKPYFFKPKIWGILRVVASTRGQSAHSTLHNIPHWRRPDKNTACRPQLLPIYFSQSLPADSRRSATPLRMGW